jgi:dTDP-4-dehydrorhamnose 3,5-epimerase
MIFAATPLAGACVIDLERIEDERGFFARTFCEEAFAAQRLASRFVQCNVSFNRRRGTLRGLHYQCEPNQEAKLVRCTMGAIWDVIVDIRPGSPTLGRWHAERLSAENRKALYVPPGFAHGFQTLTDDSEVFYQMSVAHQPGASAGISYRDNSLDIPWPIPDAAIVSARDEALPQWQR